MSNGSQGNLPSLVMTGLAQPGFVKTPFFQWSSFVNTSLTLSSSSCSVSIPQSTGRVYVAAGYGYLNGGSYKYEPPAALSFYKNGGLLLSYPFQIEDYSPFTDDPTPNIGFASGDETGTTDLGGFPFPPLIVNFPVTAFAGTSERLVLRPFQCNLDFDTATLLFQPSVTPEGAYGAVAAWNI